MAHVDLHYQRSVQDNTNAFTVHLGSSIALKTLAKVLRFDTCIDPGKVNPMAAKVFSHKVGPTDNLHSFNQMVKWWPTLKAVCIAQMEWII